MKDFFNKAANVRKLLVYVVAVVAMLLGAAEVPGFSEDGMIFGFAQESVIQTIFALLGALGVYQVRNEELPETAEE